MDETTRRRFEAAVERKKDESRERSHHPPDPAESAGDTGVAGDQESLVSAGRKTQDVFSVRDKNSGKGHKTADKWNQ
jgi:hypothetical protein